MKLSLIKNEAGLTFVELIVALGLSALLLSLVVTGAIFVERYIDNWRQRNVLTEDLAFIYEDLSEQITESQKVSALEDTLLIVDRAGDTTVYSWGDGELEKDNRRLLQPGVRLESLTARPYPLPIAGIDTILEMEGAGMAPLGLKVSATVTSEPGHRDSLTFVVRHNYEYFKKQSH